MTMTTRDWLLAAGEGTKLHRVRRRIIQDAVCGVWLSAYRTEREEERRRAHEEPELSDKCGKCLRWEKLHEHTD